jgi:hypothetical protein
MTTGPLGEDPPIAPESNYFEAIVQSVPKPSDSFETA